MGFFALILGEESNTAKLNYISNVHDFIDVFPDDLLNYSHTSKLNL